MTLDSLMAHFDTEGYSMATERQDGVETLRVSAPGSGDEKAVEFRMDITPEIRPDADFGLATLTAGGAPNKSERTPIRGSFSLLSSLIVTNITFVLEGGDMDRMEVIVDTAVEQSR
jgi:hypothetical protein